MQGQTRSTAPTTKNAHVSRARQRTRNHSAVSRLPKLADRWRHCCEVAETSDQATSFNRPLLVAGIRRPVRVLGCDTSTWLPRSTTASLVPLACAGAAAEAGVGVDESLTSSINMHLSAVNNNAIRVTSETAINVRWRIQNGNVRRDCGRFHLSLR